VTRLELFTSGSLPNQEQSNIFCYLIYHNSLNFPLEETWWSEQSCSSHTRYRCNVM